MYAQSVQLIWTGSDHPDISHYGIYRTTHIDSSFTLINTVSHPDSTYLDEGIQWDLHYCYAATSVDSYGNESGFSNVVEIDVPAVPVELSGFSVHSNNSDAILEWTTATESNNYGFEVQRSQNNPSTFKKIGFIHGNGTTATPKHYRFVDKDLPNGKYYYRLKQIDYNGDYEFSDTIQISIGLPGEFRLDQNHPNPFNSSTMISYSLFKSGHVELTICNMNGQEVYRLVDEFQEAGVYNFNWNGINFNGTKVTSGLYFYRIKALNSSKFRRMIVLR